MPLYLTEAEVGRLLTPGDAFAAVEASFARLVAGDVATVPRERLPIPDGDFAVMACVDRALGFAALKSYVWTAEGTPFLVVLFALAEARVEAVLEADRLGQLRTAAASAVAATRLARNGAGSLGIIGCGRQAASHAAAIRDALPGIARTVVYCRDHDNLDRFCAEHGCEPAESQRDAAECDIVVTATTSRDPVLRGEWLRPGALVCAVGANDPSARELDNIVLERATFVCTDSRDIARGEAGDIIEPIERGALDWLEVHELQDVVTGDLAGRAGDEDIVLFKSNGIPAWDVAVAARVVELAREQMVGREL